MKIGVSVGLLAVLFSRVDAGRLWTYARGASPAWIGTALALFALTILVSAWRWALLLRAQDVSVPGTRLVASYLVAGFFNNFLPSNIGGDVIRIKDTSIQAGSKTLATTIVLVDRGVGLIGLVFVAALGATVGSVFQDPTQQVTVPVVPWLLWLGFAVSAGLSMPALLAPTAVGRLLRSLGVFHRDWVEERALRVTRALARFAQTPRALAGCFVGALLVQTLLVLFYAAIARSMQIPVSPWSLAVIVPLTLLVQLLPVSVNGFGVREATFAFHFVRVGLPVESALAVSFVGAGLVILVSLAGIPVHVARRP
ncbi:MAG: flippase-like domain-containing protein [Acidobacteria bacterium]|nr:flippase-like domain-containing protein [Acidobacteriota bacterium]